jgi:ribosome-binding factor A
MVFRRISRRAILSASSEIGTGDGLDPRFDRPDEPTKVRNRKALQLCAQIAETLSLLFADSADPVLHNLLVTSVVPHPTSARVLVTVTTTVDLDLDLRTSLSHIEAARSRLRSEVAAAVCRRKVPDLMFRVARRR